MPFRIDIDEDKLNEWIAEEERKAAELANHPYTRNKKALDEEFELEISYPRTFEVGYIDEEESMTIAEHTLTEENPGAEITNDLYIIDITPETEIVVIAEEQNAGLLTAGAATRDYIIHEYVRVKPHEEESDD